MDYEWEKLVEKALGGLVFGLFNKLVFEAIEVKQHM